MNRIADLRSPIASLEQADAAFGRYAVLLKGLAVEDARLEKRVADLTVAHRDKTSAARQEADAVRAQLVAFVDNHRPLFKRPRTRKSELGEYGLRTATELLVSDADALLEHLLDQGYEDCVNTVRRLVKTAVRDRIAAGETMPGAAVNSGDTVVCKVSKALLDQAVEEIAD